MSAFAASWLDLREPADRRARDETLLAALSARFRERAGACVVDLGCGLGSNLRALAPHLPARQEWRLVDNDRDLLAAARTRLSAWADRTEPDGQGLRLLKEGRALTVSFAAADLAGDLDRALGPSPDLVTAAALFDLCSIAWIERLAAAVARHGADFHAALTHDGGALWQPPHPGDAAVAASFHAHLRRDKGFGPAAGVQAATALAAAFRAHGYRVSVGESPWRLDAGDAGLIARLAEGIAQAAHETGLVPAGEIALWHEARMSAEGCTIGHQDVLALAP